MKRVIFTLRRKNPYRGLSGIHLPDTEEIRSFFRRGGSIIFFLSALIAGLVAGTLSVNGFSEKALNSLDFLFMTNLPEKLKGGITGAFFASFASDFLFLGAAVFLALSLTGVVLLPATAFFKGFGTGVSAAYLISNYGIKGVLFYFCVILPGVFIFGMILVNELSAGLSIYKKVFLNLFRGRNYPLKGAFKMFMKKSLKNLLFTFGASVLDAVLWFLFAGLFNF